MRHCETLVIAGWMCALVMQPWANAADPSFDQARQSAQVAGFTLSKVQRWLHEVALPKIDPKTHLYISHPSGSYRYEEALWNYDDAAADTYPYLFWAAWYTDHALINGPILDVLEAEQRYGNYLDRIPTAVDHKTLKQVVKSKDDTIFAASEYVKDGLVAIIEVAGKDNPWFERMRDIEDDIWQHADIETPYGKIPTLNIEANGEQIQVLTRLYTMTGEHKYLEWAERLGDYYLLPGDFMPASLRDHGCESIGGFGLLLGVESEHNPAKAAVYLPHLRKMLDEILAKGTNADGMMYNQLNEGESNNEGLSDRTVTSPWLAARWLSDGWGYNYVTYLCHDMVTGIPVYRDQVKRVLGNLSKPLYANYDWEGGSVDGIGDSMEGAIYLLNRLPVPEGLAWVEREAAASIVYADDKDKLWGTYKLESNGVRTAILYALMHTRGTIARPWRQDLVLGAAETEDGLAVVMKAEQDWSGRLVFDRPRHRLAMGFEQDWPRINTMPEWFTVEPGQEYTVGDEGAGTSTVWRGDLLAEGLPVTLKAGEERLLRIRPRTDFMP